MEKKYEAESVEIEWNFILVFCVLFTQENMKFEMWNVIVWTILLPFMKIAWIVLCKAQKSC